MHRRILAVDQHLHAPVERAVEAAGVEVEVVDAALGDVDAGVNSSTLGSWPVESSRAMSSGVIRVTAAGASTMRSRRREAENTVMVSRNEGSQGIFIDYRGDLRRPLTSTVWVSWLSPSEKVSV